MFDQLEGPQIELLTREQMRPLIQPRAPDAHKGDFGRVVVVADRQGRPARPCCARKARCVRERAWDGGVTACLPADHCRARRRIHDRRPRRNTRGHGALLRGRRRPGIDADVIVAGPGLGRGEGVTTFVRELLDKCEGPLVLDADALNAFADEPALLIGREGRDLIITPHPG